MLESKFLVTYAGGKTAEYVTTDQSVEAFCNSHFGSAWEGAKEGGASVEMVAIDRTPSPEVVKSLGLLADAGNLPAASAELAEVAEATKPAKPAAAKKAKK